MPRPGPISKLPAVLAAGLLLAAACGGAPARTGESGTPSSTPTPVIETTSQPTPTPHDAKLNVVYSTQRSLAQGPRCPDVADKKDHVVLGQSRLSYSSDELGKMAAELSSTWSPDGSLLVSRPGVPTTTDPKLGPYDSTTSEATCTAGFEVTNVGSSTVQIANAGLELTGQPMPNTQSYGMVDICSLTKLDPCPPGLGGGPTPCSVRAVHVRLDASAGQTDFLAPPRQVDFETNQPCPTVTLKPKDSVSLFIDAYSADARIYRAIPALDVVASNGRGVLVVPSLAGVYAFADPSQMVCYRLSGNSFVPLASGETAVHFGDMAKLKAWCT